MNSKLPLSVIIILNKNNFYPYLSELKKSVSFAKEVLLIDTKENQIEDFSKVRNMSLGKAKCKWAFFIDADEVLTKASETEIKRIVNEDQADLVFINREDIFLGKTLRWGEVGNFELIRLGRKIAFEFERPVHEMVKIKTSHQVTHSRIVLRHFAHRSLEDFFSKIKFYAASEAKYRIKNKNEFRFWELLFFPPGKFIFNYFFKLGFLDGYRGLVYAIMMSLHSLLVRVYLLELTRLSKNEN